MIFVWASPILGGEGEAATIVARALAVCACCIIAFYYNDLYDLRLVASFGQQSSARPWSNTDHASQFRRGNCRPRHIHTLPRSRRPRRSQ